MAANDINFGSQIVSYQNANNDKVKLDETAAETVASASAMLRVSNSKTIATGGTALDLGGITTPLYIRVRNLDNTNFATMGGGLK